MVVFRRWNVLGVLKDGRVKVWGGRDGGRGKGKGWREGEGKGKGGGEGGGEGKGEGIGRVKSRFYIVGYLSLSLYTWHISACPSRNERIDTGRLVKGRGASAHNSSLHPTTTTTLIPHQLHPAPHNPDQPPRLHHFPAPPTNPPLHLRQPLQPRHPRLGRHLQLRQPFTQRRQYIR